MRNSPSGRVLGAHALVDLPAGALGIVAPNAAHSASVALPGIKVGDGVNITAPGNLPVGIYLRGWCAVAGTLAVSIQNLTATNIDMGSSDYPVAVDYSR